MRIEMNGYGGPDVLHAVEHAPATPGVGEVRVAVAAAGVNREDLRIRSGALKQQGGWPYVPGLELVGTVEAVGPSGRFRVGDRVIAIGQRLGGRSGLRPGGYQDRAVVPASTLVMIPRAVSRQDAAVLGLPAVVAWEALRRAGVSAGDRVLIHAGTSAVGQIAIRLARLIGAEVVATGRRAERFGTMLSAGADEVLDASQADWARRALPVDRAIDLVGGPGFEQTLGVVAPGGRLVLVGDLGGSALGLDADALRRGVELTGWSLDRVDQPTVQRAFDAVVRFVERGLLQLPPCTAFALADAALAHAAIEAGHVVGRVLLRPG